MYKGGVLKDETTFLTNEYFGYFEIEAFHRKAPAKAFSGVHLAVIIS